MLEGIEVLCHSSIRINKEKVIYIDPFRIDKNYNDADLIFITHDHYDHYSEEDIDKVKKQDTVIVAPEELLTKLLRKGFRQDNIITVEPYDVDMELGIKFEAIPAYNTNKQFHPKENGWVGYIIEIQGIKYYIAGDTDITEENRKVKCDVTFVPVGGTYTMDFKEAAMLINEIKPKIAIPTHYGSVVGTKQDATDFIKLLHPDIKGIILMKQKNRKEDMTMKFSSKDINLFNEAGVKVEERNYTKEEVERLRIKVTDFIMSQSTNEIDKYSRKFSDILY